MTPAKLAALIDGLGTDLERWPAVDRAAARALLAESEAARALLRRAELVAAALAPHGDAAVIDAARLDRVRALTRAAARQTRQLPPPLGVRLRRWLDPAAAQVDGLWRFCAPLTAALVLGVVVGQASLDRTTSAPASDAATESPLTTLQSLELSNL
jgi:hypothetical protein